MPEPIELIKKLVSELSLEYPVMTFYYGKSEGDQHYVQVDSVEMFNNNCYKASEEDLIQKFTESYPDIGLIFNTRFAEIGRPNALFFIKNGIISSIERNAKI